MFPPEQVGPPHGTVAAKNRHVPSLAHWPSVPQGETTPQLLSGSVPSLALVQLLPPLQTLQVPAHSRSGSVLAVWLVHTPGLVLQAWQVRLQGLLQQYPSTQLPLMHSLPAAEPLQVWPSGFLSAQVFDGVQ